MSCWTSCSGEGSRAGCLRSRPLLALLVVAWGTSCATAEPAPSQPELRTFVLLPPENLGPSAATLEDLRATLEGMMNERGIRLITGPALVPFLERHRIRFTGGVSPEIALLAKEELGADGVLVTSLLVQRSAQPPKTSLMMRLVSTEPTPRILWFHGASLAGDENPGFFDLGIIEDPEQVRGRVLEEVVASLAAFLKGKGPAATACAGGERFSPQTNSIAAAFAPRSGHHTVAVLPFVNQSSRRNAGPAVALEFARQLAAVGNFDVLEPGVLREELLRYRIIMENGIALHQARLLQSLVGVDYLLSGTVYEYEDQAGLTGAPRVSISAILLDQRTDQVVWQASSQHAGDDGVFFFRLGTVGTAGALLCRMISAATSAMLDADALGTQLSGQGTSELSFDKRDSQWRDTRLEIAQRLDLPGFTPASIRYELCGTPLRLEVRSSTKSATVYRSPVAVGPHVLRVNAQFVGGTKSSTQAIDRATIDVSARHDFVASEGKRNDLVVIFENKGTRIAPVLSIRFDDREMPAKEGEQSTTSRLPPLAP